ncbi:hypothetical protein QN277_022364 [Acacia crassicarpa]|uniref:Uncharacterized protein n=1 Tax=Acacia crassicarpa TaxID=499986 RepID=A0AAE1JET1_9FABA|nr:hypothetical protein QN277_022364 [Acacia crassicarpa]
MGERLWMHDLIEKMGWEIVHQDCIKETGRRTRLWDPKEVYDVLKNNRDLVNLKRIDLRFSRKLRELPDFSKARNLELVNLYNCVSLCNVHLSILSLHSLVSLDLSKCKNIKSLQSGTHLRSLRKVVIGGCPNLKEFSLSSKELRCLLLGSTGIEILHPLIRSLTKLRCLHFNGSKLKKVPLKELCCLRSLRDLRISEHAFDKPELHMLFDALRALQILSCLNCSNLTELPNNIKQLS